MADLKISQLTGATTPLAGTEFVPLVQSNTTKKVSVADLTAGRAVSMSSLGVGTSSINGAATIQNASVRVEIGEVFGANYFESLNNGRTDSVGLRLYSQTLGIFTKPVAGSYSQAIDVGTTGNITFNIGNLIQGTAGKGINFTANTPAAGMTSQLLNWYEEGTWTPTITFGGNAVGVAYAFQSGRYTRIGRAVYYTLSLTLSNKGSSTGDAYVNGLPFTVANIAGINPDGTMRVVTGVTFTAPLYAAAIGNTTTVGLLNNNAGAQQFLTNASFSNTSDIAITGVYFV